MNVGFLERPLIIGFLAASLTGQPVMCMGIAVFFELFWLDLFPAGTYIPPHHAAATVSAIGLSYYYHAFSPPDALLAIILSVPLAWIGVKIEKYHRVTQNREYSILVSSSRRSAHGVFPEKLVFRGVALKLLLDFSILGALFGVLWYFYPMLLGYWAIIFKNANMAWGHFWFVASIGGVLSLRWKRSYGLVAMGVALLVLAEVTELTQFFVRLESSSIGSF